MMDETATIHCRISTAVRPGWIIFTNRSFIVGMMPLSEYLTTEWPQEFDLIHISDADRNLAEAIRTYRERR